MKWSNLDTFPSSASTQLRSLFYYSSTLVNSLPGSSLDAVCSEDTNTANMDHRREFFQQRLSITLSVALRALLHFVSFIEISNDL
jgi:hypothetical protein